MNGMISESISTRRETINERAAAMKEFFARPLLRAISSNSTTVDVASINADKRKPLTLIFTLPVRDSVEESLERSLEEYADIWIQLS